MKILHISDTHNLHPLLVNLPPADVIVHSGDFTDMGTEEEVLDFLNWFIELPYQYKIFITGNHDLCLWDAENIEDLPENVYFLQDRAVVIEGVKFFGLGYNHSEKLIPKDTDVLITHEPPRMILDVTEREHWGSAAIRNKVFEIKPRYHLFGHDHESFGVLKQDGVVFSNGSVLDDQYRITHPSKVFQISKV